MSAILILPVTGVADAIGTQPRPAISSSCTIFDKLVADHRSPQTTR